MDSNFWVGLLAGGIVSLIGSVLANLYTNNIYAFIGKRVEFFSERRKKRELKRFYLVALIMCGKIDRNAMFISRALLSILNLILVSLFASLLIPTFDMTSVFDMDKLAKASFTFDRLLSNVRSQWILTTAQLVMLIIMSYSAFASLKYLSEFTDLWSRLDQYPRYREQIRSQWPDEVSQIETDIHSQSS